MVKAGIHKPAFFDSIEYAGRTGFQPTALVT